MLRPRTLLPLLLMLLVATPALAAFEYYTYDGFEPISRAFVAISHIFKNNQMVMLAAVGSVIGMTVGGIAFFVRSMTGAQANPVSVFLPAIVGMGLYVAMFTKTETLIVYDTHTGQFQSIPDVPQGIVYIASAINDIETGLVGIIETAFGGAGSVQQAAGAYNLLTAGSFLNPGVVNAQVYASVQAYIDDCATFEILSNPGGGLNAEAMRKSKNFMPQLALAKNPAIFTQYYDSATPNGTSVSCEQAWSSLEPILNDPNTFTQAVTNGCGTAGFGTSTEQVDKCRALAEGFLNSPTGMNLGGATLETTARQGLIAEALFNVIQNGAPLTGAATKVNRDMATKGMGTLVAANEWLPYFKAGMTAVALGLIPIMAVFVATPLVGQALSFIFGVFVFLAAWGVADAVATASGAIYTTNLASAIRDTGLGLDTYVNFPDYNTKMVSVFATLRSMAVAFAGLISMMLVKFGGHFLSGMASNMMGQVQGAGATGGALLTPEGKTQASTGLITSVGAQSWMNSPNFSFGGAAAADGIGRSHTMGANLAFGGHSPAFDAGEYSTTGQVKTMEAMKKTLAAVPNANGDWRNGMTTWKGNEAAGIGGTITGQENQGSAPTVAAAAQAQAEENVATGAATLKKMAEASPNGNASAGFQELGGYQADTKIGDLEGKREADRQRPGAVRNAAAITAAGNIGKALGQGGPNADAGAAMAQQYGTALMEYGKNNEVINGLVKEHFGGNFMAAGAMMAKLSNAQTMGGIMSTEALQGWAQKTYGKNLSFDQAATLQAFGQKTHYMAGGTEAIRQMASGKEAPADLGFRTINTAATNMQDGIGKAEATQSNADYRGQQVDTAAYTTHLGAGGHPATAQEAANINHQGAALVAAGKLKNFEPVNEGDVVSYKRTPDGGWSNLNVTRRGSQNTEQYDTSSVNQNRNVDLSNSNTGPINRDTHASPAGLVQTTKDHQGNLLEGSLKGTLESRTVENVHDEGDGTTRPVVATTTSAPDGTVARDRQEGGASREQHEQSERWHAGYKIDGVISGAAGEAWGDTAKRGIGAGQSIVNELAPLGAAIGAFGRGVKDLKNARNTSTSPGKGVGAQMNKEAENWGKYFERAGWTRPEK